MNTLSNINAHKIKIAIINDTISNVSKVLRIYEFKIKL